MKSENGKIIKIIRDNQIIRTGLGRTNSKSCKKRFYKEVVDRKFQKNARRFKRECSK